MHFVYSSQTCTRAVSQTVIPTPVFFLRWQIISLGLLRDLLATPVFTVFCGANTDSKSNPSRPLLREIVCRFVRQSILS